MNNNAARPKCKWMVSNDTSNTNNNNNNNTNNTNNNNNNTNNVIPTPPKQQQKKQTTTTTTTTTISSDQKSHVQFNHGIQALKQWEINSQMKEQYTTTPTTKEHDKSSVNNLDHQSSNPEWKIEFPNDKNDDGSEYQGRFLLPGIKIRNNNDINQPTEKHDHTKKNHNLMGKNSKLGLSSLLYNHNQITMLPEINTIIRTESDMDLPIADVNNIKPTLIAPTIPKKPKSQNNNDDDLDDMLFSYNPKVEKIDSSCQLWSEKYRPTKPSEVAGNSLVIQQLRNWIKEKKNGCDESKINIPLAAFLFGPPGVGKTSIAHSLLTEYGYCVYEINASEMTSQKQVYDKICELVCGSTIREGKRTAVIVDEIDGGSNFNTVKAYQNNKKDNTTKKPKKGLGPIEGVLDVIEWGKKNPLSSKNWSPIICVANEAFGRPAKRLKEATLSLKFGRIFNNTMLNILNRVTSIEKIKMSNYNKNRLVEQSGGDARRMMNLLYDHYLSNSSDVVSGSGSGSDLKMAVSSNTGDLDGMPVLHTNNLDGMPVLHTFNLDGMLANRTINPPSLFFETSKKDYFDDVFKRVENILYGKKMNIFEAVCVVESDRDLITLMIYENVPNIFIVNKVDRTQYGHSIKDDGNNNKKNYHGQGNKFHKPNPQGMVTRFVPNPQGMVTRFVPNPQGMVLSHNSIQKTFQNDKNHHGKYNIQCRQEKEKEKNSNNNNNRNHNLALLHGQSCDKLSEFFDNLSEIDMIEHVSPIYNDEDVGVESIKDMLNSLLVLSVSMTRPIRTDSVSNHFINQQTFFQLQSEIKDKKSDLLSLSRKIATICDNDNNNINQLNEPMLKKLKETKFISKPKTKSCFNDLIGLDIEYETTETSDEETTDSNTTKSFQHDFIICSSEKEMIEKIDFFKFLFKNKHTIDWEIQKQCYKLNETTLDELCFNF